MKNTANNKYQHYKTGQIYEMIGMAYHSETKEEMVVYRGLYDCEKFGKNPWFVRPKKMFFEKILWNGQHIPRFKPVVDEEIENFSVSV
jgi:hypothetical protein